MSVNIVQWRVEIGAFDVISNVRYLISRMASTKSIESSKKSQYFFHLHFFVVIYVGGYRIKYRTQLI